MKNKILIMGLPGSGKTALSNALKSRIPAVMWNADEVRQNINKHLTYSLKDRIQQAKTMKFLADKVVESGRLCIVDFVCPTYETREAFNADDAFVIWMDRIGESRFEDTNVVFMPPHKFDVRVINDGRSADDWADDIAESFVW